MRKILSTCQTTTVAADGAITDCTTSTEEDAYNTSLLRCRVCGAVADGQHFGTSACRACAAFFRRTISRRLRYICRFDNDCEIGDLSRSVCRSCRLAKCVEVGMNGRAVRSQQANIVRPAPRRRTQKPYDAASNTTVINENNGNVSAKQSTNKREHPSTHKAMLPLVTSTTSPNGAASLCGGTSPPLAPPAAYQNIICQDLSLTMAANLSPSPPTAAAVTAGAVFDLAHWPVSGSAAASYFNSDGVFAFTPVMSPDMNVITPYANTVSTTSALPPSAALEINVDSSSAVDNTLLIESDPAVGTSTSEFDPSTDSDKLSSSASSSSFSYLADEGKRRLLYEVVEIQAADYFVDESTLPVTHPTLAKVHIAYEGLQRRRDAHFSRSRDCNGQSTRIYIERQVFDVHQYWKNIRLEIEWVAEMLSTFDNYSLIPNVDKVQIFKHYWIHFIILERSFDTYRVLGTSPHDLRMVFANGDINDVVVGEYDIKEIADAKDYGIKSITHPWFRSAALEILVPLKKLQPTEPEMMFCLALMFWKLTYNVMSRVAMETAQIAEQMTELLYREIFMFYTAHLSNVNFVKRVGELVRLIGITERLVLHRKEDIVMQRTFKPFKVDLYMEEIFESD